MVKLIKIDGRLKKLYTVEEIAIRLGRSPQTIRKWERDGLLPKPKYMMPTNRKMGKFTRLYSPGQVDKVVEIIERHGFVQGTNNADRKLIAQELLSAFSSG